MTGLRPLGDAELDRLLAFDRPPPMSADLVDRIAAEAVRVNRVPALSAQPLRRRSWARKRFIAAFVAFNLIGVSAIAAALGGHVIEVPRLVALSNRILHQGHAAAAEPRHVRKSAVARSVAIPPAPAVALEGMDDRPASAPLQERPRRWMMRSDPVLRELIRERRLDRLLGLPPVSRAERTPMFIQRSPADMADVETWHPARPFAARREPYTVTGRDGGTPQRMQTPRAGRWAHFRAARRSERERRLRDW